MAAIARKAGCSVSTTTSGLIMNEELAAEIVESGLDIVAFSLAGSDASSNASRHGVDFDRVCEAVRILQAVRRSRMGVHLEIHLAYLLLSSQMEAAVRLPKLMHSLGIHAAVVSTLDFIPSPDLAAEGFAPHETDKIARCATLLGKAQAEARRMGMDFHWSLPGARPLMSNCRENALRSLFVSADGFVSPCVYVNLPLKDGHPNRCVFGDVLDEDPPALWEGKEFREFRERLAGGAPDIPCVGCPKRFET
jgi:MoaA/NifB/PqqE/SkfB family radical SAM enzyme